MAICYSSNKKLIHAVTRRELLISWDFQPPVNTQVEQPSWEGFTGDRMSAAKHGIDKAERMWTWLGQCLPDPGSQKRYVR